MNNNNRDVPFMLYLDDPLGVYHFSNTTLLKIISKPKKVNGGYMYKVELVKHEQNG